MWTLSGRREAAPPALLGAVPARALAALGVGLLVTAVLVQARVAPAAALGVAVLAAVHGALLGVALTWIAGVGTPAALVPALLLAFAAAAAAVAPVGALVYLAVPVWLVLAARVRGPRTARLAGGRPLRAVLVGAGVGVALGGHLLATAALTLGYHVVAGPVTLTALAYDLGANVPSAECFFRGALFDRLHRRGPFARAAAVSTAAMLVRYLADPLLPKASETLLGALFYLALLGAANCWLLWWSGSLVPGALAALLFFAAYRLLVVP
jgi:hypothetical protein